MANEVNIRFRVRGVIDQPDTSNTTNSLVTKTKGADTVYEFTADYYKTFDAVSPKTVTVGPDLGGGGRVEVTPATISDGDVIIFNNLAGQDLDVTLYSNNTPDSGFAKISPGESMFVVSDGSNIYAYAFDATNVHVIHFETTNPS